MRTSDKPDFLRVMNGMAAMRKTQLIPEVLDLWWACMTDWAIEDFKAATLQVLKSTDFMPTPKDFEDLRKAGRPSSGEAWARVVALVRSGSWRYDTGLDELTNAAVDALGGYKAIAMHDESALHFLERRFAEHYETIQDKREIREAVPAIAQRPAWLTVDLTRKRLAQS